jgi:LysM repeat protein
MTTNQVSPAVSPETLVDVPRRCPHLAGPKGAWVASEPSGDHRCAAVAPPTAVTQEKQRRLCLTDEHPSCATYIAALESRSSRIAESERAAGWGWVRTLPVVDARLGLGASIGTMISERRGWQFVPAVALVAALGALGLANLGSPSGAASPTPRVTSPVVVVASPTVAILPTSEPSSPASAVPTTTPPPSPTPVPTVTPAPTPARTATPVPSARASYTVKSGDTLYGISRQFGVTVPALMDFNGLTSTVLRVGQVLRIP